MNQKSKKGKWLGLLSLMPAMGMVFVDQAVLPVALPTIQSHLGGGASEVWWAINSYLLVSAVLLLTGGKIGDRIGYRKTYLWGLVVFAIASALCGISPSMIWLIVARALQGLGAALLIPSMSPLVMSLFPQNERGKAIGVNVSISSLFLILAPLIGGYFAQDLSWRWIFYINLPLAVLGIILVNIYLEDSPKGTQKFDPWGFIFFALWSFSLITLIMQESKWDWASFPTITLLTLCIVSAISLFLREKKSPHPFIDLSLFRHPIFKAVNISIFATQFVLMASIYRAIFFQETLGWSPIKSGSILCITSLPVLFMSPIGGWLADRFGSKTPLFSGFALLSLSFFWLGLFIQGPLWVVLIGLFAFGLGVPMIFTPAYSSAMGAVPPKKAGLAFGVLATTRAFAASLGVAVIGALALDLHIRSFLSLASPSGTDPALLQKIALGQRANAPAAFQKLLKESQLNAFFDIHLLIGFSLLIAFALVAFLYKRKASHHLPEAPAEGWD